jgi:hypothetical protein
MVCFDLCKKGTRETCMHKGHAGTFPDLQGVGQWRITV